MRHDWKWLPHWAIEQGRRISNDPALWDSRARCVLGQTIRVLEPQMIDCIVMGIARGARPLVDIVAGNDIGEGLGAVRRDVVRDVPV